jgi:two-component system, cell cycle response regulator DivK
MAMLANSTRILVVEDTWDIRNILTRLLERNGYQVITTANGQAALAAFQSERPDLILLDLSMPVLNGWQTHDAIRALPGGSEIPIIAVTAHAMVGDREAILAHGFDSYIQKPFTLRSILDVVHQHVGTNP